MFAKLRVSWILLCGFSVIAMPASAAELMRWTRSDGSRVMYIESRSNPILDIKVEFDAGSRWDPVDKAGLAEMTAGLLDAGTNKMNEERVREALADVAASLSTSVDADRAGLHLRTLSTPKERRQAVAVMANVLAHPQFPEAVLAREKARAIEGLRQQDTDPADLARRKLMLAMYGSHPYARDAMQSIQSVRSIHTKDLVQFWRRHYRASQAVVTVVGDVSREEADSLASELLTALPVEAVDATSVPEVKPASSVMLRLPHSASQAAIYMGMPLLTRKDPDYFPLLVGNYILGGGGFDSRLMRELRDKRGYTYGVSSYMNPMAAAGEFVVGFSTQRDQAESALQVAQSVLSTFIEQGPTKAELDQAKNNIIGGFPLRFDSNRKLLEFAAVIGFYDLPLSFLEEYPQKIAAVSVEAVKAAFQQRVHKGQWQTVVVGVPDVPRVQ